MLLFVKFIFLQNIIDICFKKVLLILNKKIKVNNVSVVLILLCVKKVLNGLIIVIVSYVIIFVSLFCLVLVNFCW